MERKIAAEPVHQWPFRCLLKNNSSWKVSSFETRCRSNCGGDSATNWAGVHTAFIHATFDTAALANGSFAYVYGRSLRNSKIEKLSLLT